MLDFYRRVWVEKKPKWLALKDAKRRLRDAKDESGQPKYTLRDWGAWVLTGEPDRAQAARGVAAYIDEPIRALSLPLTAIPPPPCSPCSSRSPSSPSTPSRPHSSIA